MTETESRPRKSRSSLPSAPASAVEAFATEQASAERFRRKRILLVFDTGNIPWRSRRAIVVEPAARDPRA
jgi:hypothetical protein